MNTVGLIVSIIAIAFVILAIYLTRNKSAENNVTISKTTTTKATTIHTTLKDDLTKVEGIGPKISSLLEAEGIHTYGDLAKADVAKLKALMDSNNLRIADPTTWPKQSMLLAEGKLDELQKLQDNLKGGRQ